MRSKSLILGVVASVFFCGHKIAAGIYKYFPKNHALELVVHGDKRKQLSQAALDQQWVAEAPVSIVTCAVYSRSQGKYSNRAFRYIAIEIGCIAENIYLQATALSLGAVLVGAFEDEVVKNIIGYAANEEPLSIMPIGYPK